MKYFVIAGEASGDMHGARLIAALRKKDLHAEIQGWGGDKMEAAGAKILKHYRHLAFMGFWEVILNLKTIFKNLRLCKKHIEDFQPHVIILVDYPGFNMRIARWAKHLNYKIIYYISPQIWAWKSSRVHELKRNVDKMLVILPFEVEFYKRYNFQVHYVGHPLIEHVRDFLNAQQEAREQKWIVLMPGSRIQEIKKILPPMLEAASLHPQEQFVVIKADSIDEQVYEPYLRSFPSIRLVQGNSYAYLYHAKAALVKSGTSTLETALMKVPEVVCYRGNALSYQIGKRLVKIDFISLVNLIGGKKIVEELIQHDCNPQKIAYELDRLLNNEAQQKWMLHEFDQIEQVLQTEESASNKAARMIIDMANPNR